jgi:outer membrane protein OmpA-like peptidoglycan-associated protein
MEKKMKRPVIAAIACVMLLASLPAVGQQVSVESEIAAIETRMAVAMGAHLDLIAPDAFAEAQGKLADAKERFKKGGKIEDIHGKLNQAGKKLDRADQLQKMGDLLLKDALTAHADAMEAKAPKFAREEWDQARQKMHDAGREIEKGNQNQARSKAAEAAGLFRVAELQAIRTDLLGQANKVRTTAREADAHEKAPQTFTKAERELQSAEQTLKGDRYQRAEAAGLARQAALDFEHARLIAKEVDTIGAKNDGEVEKLILANEDAVHKIATILAVEADFSQGFSPVTESVGSAASSLLADRADLQAQLLDRERRLAATRAKIDSLDTMLATLENRARSTDLAMAANDKRRKDLNSVENLFGSNEASVLMQGENLIIRLYGLSFQSGSSVIQAGDFRLLTKLQSALRTFPGAPVEIEGHSDSVGDDQYNQALSLKRAEAVRSYLTANMAGDEARLQAAGFGASVPLASNETAEGRAKNRRIDVRIDTAVR